MRRIRVNPSHDELLPFPGWKLPVTAHMSTGCLLASLGGRSFGVSVFVADGLDIRSSGSQINLGERDMVLPWPRRNLISVTMAVPLMIPFQQHSGGQGQRLAGICLMDPVHLVISCIFCSGCPLVGINM